MKKFVSFSAAAIAASLVSSDLMAQRDLEAGFSAQSIYIDLDAATNEVGSLGVQHLNGEIFASTRIDPGVGGLHFVTVFDNTGTALRSWFQPGFAQASEWGFRDGASDGTNIAFGFDFGIEIIDKDGVLQDGFTPGTAIPNWQTQNGAVNVLGGLVSGNVLAPEQAGINRGNAYDRTGNGGDGSFWTGNFGSSVFEIDTNGDILTTYPNADETTYGFGLDPASRLDGNGDIDPTFPPTRMWINAAGTPLEIAEYDLTTGTLTGQKMDPIQGVQGGLDVVPGKLGRGGLAGGYDVLMLMQGGPDEIRQRRVHMDIAGEGIPPAPFTRLGTDEPDLLNTVDNEEFWPISDNGTTIYTSQSTSMEMIIDLSRNPGDGMGTGGLNGTPGVIFVNVGNDAAPGVDSTGNILNIRELAHLQPGLTAPQPVFAVRSKGFVMTNNPLNPVPGWNVILTPGAPFQPIGDCVRPQGLWLDNDVAFLPLALTNQNRFCRGADPVILTGTYAVMLGNNTFNADTSAGYFQVINEETDTNLSIVSVTYGIDFGGSPSANSQALIDDAFRWDTDNGGMADLFEGGDSLVVDCLGTYRNGSEVTTGLIFAGTTQQNATPCDPLSLQGWVGSIDGPTAYGAFDGDWLQLDFTFASDTFLNGAKFEFDVDTDGGVGVSGNDMAGVVVSVQFKNGSVSTAEIIPDANIPFRAFAQL